MTDDVSPRASSAGRPLGRRRRRAALWGDRGAASRLRRVLAGLVLGGALLCVSLAGCGALTRPLIFPGDDTPLPPVGTEVAAGVEVIEYPGEEGPLRGLVARAPAGAGAAEVAAPRPALVLFHGNAESAARQVAWAQQLAAAGCDVLVAEYRGYGGCPGSPSEDGLVADGRAAVAAAERHLGAGPAEVVLVGRSLGTGVACALAGAGLGRAVALLSPFTSVTDLARELAPDWLVALLLRDHFPSLGALRSRPDLPVLVIHGTHDGVIPFAHGQRLAQELGPRARLIPLQGVGHNDLFLRAGDRVVAAVSSFAQPR